MNYFNELPKDIRNIVKEHLEPKIIVRKDKGYFFTIVTDAFEYNFLFDDNEENKKELRSFLKNLNTNKYIIQTLTRHSSTLTRHSSRLLLVRSNNYELNFIEILIDGSNCSYVISNAIIAEKLMLAFADIAEQHSEFSLSTQETKLGITHKTISAGTTLELQTDYGQINIALDVQDPIDYESLENFLSKSGKFIISLPSYHGYFEWRNDNIFIFINEFNTFLIVGKLRDLLVSWLQNLLVNPIKQMQKFQTNQDFDQD